MNEQEILIKGIEFASELSKQLITLAISVITITITFKKDFSEFNNKKQNKLMKFSWILFFVSIVFGVLHLMSLTGLLIRDNIGVYNLNIQPNAKFFFLFQALCFLLALILFLAYGSKILANRK